jgi:hypothetical protein
VHPYSSKVFHQYKEGSGGRGHHALGYFKVTNKQTNNLNRYIFPSFFIHIKMFPKKKDVFE